MSTKHKLDIFKVLGHISKKEPNFYLQLSEEEQKALQPLVVMRWLSGTRNPRQIYFLNELVNPFVFSMSKHKPLLIDLMTMCTPGKPQKYFWNKTNSKKVGSMPTSSGVIQEYFGYNSRDANDALQILDEDSVIWCAEQLGRQPDDIKSITKEFRSRGR